MSLTKAVRQLLHHTAVPYEVLSHPEAFTAQEIADKADISGWALAKVVVLRAGNGTYRMIVLPAPAHLDLGRYREVTGDLDVELANESELARLFPDCEVGAMPPFGGLYDMPVAVDSCLTHSGDFFFQAGNHHEIVRMRYEDFHQLERPSVSYFCDLHQPSLIGV